MVSDDVHGTLMVLPVSVFTTTYTTIGITQRLRNGKPKNHTESTVFRCNPDMRTFRVDRRQLLGTFAQNNRICAIHRHEQEVVHGPFRTNLYKTMVSSEWMLPRESRVDVQSCTGRDCDLRARI
jgi:hypothetical protein